MNQHPPFKDMSDVELAAWFKDTREQLAAKKQRELDYITRRAHRGVRTPTDEAYERDQVLLADILEFLDTAIEEAHTHD